MSKGYYIYYDQRDWGMGDMWFVGWIDVRNDNMVFADKPIQDGEYVPIFNPSCDCAVCLSKAKADKTVEVIVNMYPELEEELHGWMLEEVPFE